MKVFTRNLDINEDIEIRIVGDLHIGGETCNYKEIEKLISYIEKTENCYCVVNGDIIDCTLKNSVGNVYYNKFNPMEQLEIAIKYLSRIKDKILVIHPGNHEERAIKEIGVDLTALIAMNLGLSEIYSDDTYYIYLYFGEKEKGRKAPMCYTLCGNHGLSSNSDKCAERLSNIAVADLYLLSHFHKSKTGNFGIYIPDYGNKTLNFREQKFLVGSGYLDYEGSYGSKKLYKPNCITCPRAILHNKERYIDVIS